MGRGSVHVLCSEISVHVREVRFTDKWPTFHVAALLKDLNGTDLPPSIIRQGGDMRKSTYDRVMVRRQTDSLWLAAEKFEDTDSQKRFRMLRTLLATGHDDPGIMTSVAMLYADGEGVKRSRSQALRWSRRAWRRGYSIAALNCGIDETKSSRTESAVKWFLRAIDLGDVDAPFYLAKLYLEVGCNYQEAAKLLKMRISAGPQESFTVSPGVEPIRVLEDGDFEEAKHLLSDLEARLQ